MGLVMGEDVLSYGDSGRWLQVAVSIDRMGALQGNESEDRVAITVDAWRLLMGEH